MKRRFAIFRAAALTMLVLNSGASLAVAEAYLLQPGDVLQLSVVGEPGLDVRLPVGVDGAIVAPLAGEIPASGRTLESVADDLRLALSSANYTIVNSAGDVVSVQINPTSVFLSVFEYLPVYVDGDVEKPGAFAFTPNLTARRSITLAGGYGLARLRSGDPVLQVLETQSKLHELLVQKAASNARIERLKSELAGETSASEPGEASSASLDDRFAAIERERLETSRTRDAERDVYFDSAHSKTLQQIDSLRNQFAGENEGVQADTEDFERLRDAQTSGSITATRLADARRTLLFSTTRQLQTGSELARTERELGGLDYEQATQRLNDRAAALAEMSDAAQKVAEIDAQIVGLRQKLAYFVGAADGAQSEDAVAVSITRTDGTTVDVAPSEDAALRPGDLVRVHVRDMPLPPID